jgi:hypothetical protein
MPRKRTHTQFSFDAFTAGTGPDLTPPAAATPPATALGGAESLAVREVLGFCPRLLSGLPAPSTLVCEHAEAGLAVFTTSAAVYAASANARPTFTGTELAAIALATEHDRGAFEEWCKRKRYMGAAWRLNAAAALGPVYGRFDPLGWTIGRVFERLGLALVAVYVTEAGEVPPLERRSHVATVAR